MVVQTSEAVFEYFRYKPSIPAAAVFAVLFSITSFLHAYQLFRTRTWILIPIVLGGFCETTGYIARIFSSLQSPDYTISTFIIQGTLTLLAPALFAATIYMCLGRIIRATCGDALSPVRPSRLTFLFVLGEVLGLAIQGVGAIIMPLGTLEDFYTGEKIVIAGLAALAASFGLFIVVALIFDRRIRKAPTRQSMSIKLDWKRELRALYISSSLIFLRSIFRLIEYSQGNSGWLIAHEWTLYVFDTISMLAVLALFNIVHPSRIQSILHGGPYSQMAGMRIVDAKPEVGLEDLSSH